MCSSDLKKCLDDFVSCSKPLISVSSPFSMQKNGNKNLKKSDVYVKGKSCDEFDKEHSAEYSQEHSSEHSPNLIDLGLVEVAPHTAPTVITPTSHELLSTRFVAVLKRGLGNSTNNCTYAEPIDEKNSKKINFNENAKHVSRSDNDNILVIFSLISPLTSPSLPPTPPSPSTLFHCTLSHFLPRALTSTRSHSTLPSLSNTTAHTLSLTPTSLAPLTDCCGQLHRSTTASSFPRVRT